VTSQIFIPGNVERKGRKHTDIVGTYFKSYLSVKTTTELLQWM